ncbi:Arf GTPase activating protein, partial [Dillenia turbinata]
MNEKATVSKELNDKHAKILEGLLKLPSNRECADCRNKAPRWASVNLGIFICMQCSGIHRSLGPVYYFGYMAARAGCFHAMYEERRWVPKNSAHTIPRPIENCNRPNNSVDGATKSRIPKKTRTYSLDEGILNNYMAQVAPPSTTARPRWGSVDMGDISNVSTIPGGNSSKTKPAAPTKQTGAGTDLFNLLYGQEPKGKRSSLPPRSWATFD